jgi:capsular polysaccharide biosynthesis protein
MMTIPDESPEARPKPKVDVRRVLVDLWRRKWLLLIVLVLAGLAGYFGGKKLSKETYETAASLIYRPNDEKKSDNSDPQKSLNTLKEIVKVRTNLEAVRTRLHLDNTLEQIGKAVDVDVEKNTNLLTITATWPTAQGAANLANAVEDAFLDSQVSLDRRQAQLQRAEQARRRDKVDKELSLADKDLQDYMRGNQISDFTTMARAYLEGFNSADLAFQQALVEEGANAQQVKNLDRIVEDQKKKVAADRKAASSMQTLTDLSTKIERLRSSIADDQQMRARQADLALAKINLDNMTKLNAEGAVSGRKLQDAQSAYDKQKALAVDTDQVKQWRAELEKLQNTVLPSDSPSQSAQLLLEMMSRDFELQMTSVSAGVKVASLRKARDEYQGKLASLPDMQHKYALLVRQVDTLTDERKTLDTDIARYDRLLQITSPDFLTVARANVPSLPKTSNHKTMTIMCGVGVLALGWLAIIGSIFMDPRLKSKGDLAAAAKQTVLGEVTAYPRRLAEFPPPASSETAVTMSALTRGIRRQVPRRGARIAIAGIRLGDGASSLASGVACSLSRQGERVLLVSLSQPKNATELTYPEMQPSDWVTAAMVGGTPLSELAGGGSPGRPFALPPFGNAVSADDLTSIPMRSALVSAEEAFDIVVFDLEPIREGLQVELVGPFCDGVILVAHSGSMKRDTVRQVERDLESAGVPVVGWILNFVPKMYQ